MSAISTSQQSGEPFDGDSFNDHVFNLHNITRSIASMKVVKTISNEEKLERPDVDPGKSDVPLVNTFESSERHSDVSPQDLSERWGISLAQATITLKKTTQRFLRSAVLPLSRRYRTDRVFTRKTLRGDWSTDTISV